MVFNSDAYERAFPREPAAEVKTPELPKQGDVLEEVDKVVKKDPEPDLGGGAADGD